MNYTLQELQKLFPLSFYDVKENTLLINFTINNVEFETTLTEYNIHSLDETSFLMMYIIKTLTDAGCLLRLTYDILEPNYVLDMPNIGSAGSNLSMLDCFFRVLLRKSLMINGEPLS